MIRRLSVLPYLPGDVFKALRASWEPLLSGDQQAEKKFLTRALEAWALQARGARSGKTASRFFAALGPTETPATGGLLSLANDVRFPFHREACSLFVRDCYVKLFELLYASPCRAHIVTGTPGIGKSWFLYYLLVRLLSSPSPPSAIIIEHLSLGGYVWCYMHETGDVWMGKRETFEEVFLDEDAWYISDGVPPREGILARQVLVTSPEWEVYKGMHKSGARLLCMPVWSLAELLACRSALYDMVPADLVVELFEHWGGVPRHTLENPRDNPGASLATLLAPLERALQRCSTEKVCDALLCIMYAHEDCYSFLHIAADDKFLVSGPLFASKWAAEELVKRAEARDELDGPKGVAQALSSIQGPARGMLLEGVMHAVLPKGGWFRVTRLCLGTREREGERELRFPVSTAKVYPEGADISAASGTYYRFQPKGAAHPSVRSFACRERAWDFFHMTVSSSGESLDASQLRQLFREVRLPKGVVPRVFFVVPPDVYGTFKVTLTSDWSAKKWKRMEVYVLRADTPLSQGRRLAKSQGRPLAKKRKRGNC